MVLLRFAGAEVDGDPTEIASILKALSAVSQEPHTQESTVAPSKPTFEEQDIPEEILLQRIPDLNGLVKMIEEMGRPFSFNLAEQQKKIFGKLISSRRYQRVYSRFYDVHKRARKEIVKKYGGQWGTLNEVVDGHQTTRFVWSENQDVKAETVDLGTHHWGQIESRSD
ncbi:MAG: hypothetical protein M0Q47_04175 [Methanothrix sp.]|jgi:hypothetical protein|uniref:hypothetical protein n=1 Tax=Methanothrix sp. TaxID=90426 RepID=UPI0025EC892A|nr:hypothetical protein [Methanothrix sp.]MCK9405592.1 hypothetical protein [Methanothrix sp.]